MVGDKGLYTENTNNKVTVGTVKSVLFLMEHLTTTELNIIGDVDMLDDVIQNFDIRANKELETALEVSTTIDRAKEYKGLEGKVLAGIKASLELNIIEMSLNGKRYHSHQFSEVAMNVVEMFLEQNPYKRVLMLFETGKKVPIYVNSFKSGEYFRKLKTAKESRITLFKNNQIKMLDSLKGRELSAIYVFEDGLTEENFIERHKLSAITKVDENQFRVVDKTVEEVTTC